MPREDTLPPNPSRRQRYRCAMPRRGLSDTELHARAVQALGVPSSKAGQLAALDTLGFLVLALVVGIATVPIVDRRRPV
jgi:hypothetical protein